jgi:hypothetical protein
MLFLGDNHDGEVVVGRRDANWARGNPAVTNILLPSAVWAVEAVFADQNALGTRPESRSGGGW